MDSTTSDIILPSERKFGLTFAALFAAVAARLWWAGRLPAASLWVAASLVLAAMAMLAPSVLAAPNRVWFRIGLALSRIVSPVVISAIFLLIVTPVGLLARLSGRDALRIRPRRRDSYWIRRDPPGPPPESFHRQF
jgi:hypothetical protein